MVFSPNANWVHAVCRATREVRYRVTIHLDVGVSKSFTDGPCDQLTDPTSLISVSPLPRSVDPITREPSVAQASIVMHADPYVRYLVTTYGLTGFMFDVEIGEKTLAAADFEPFFSGRCLEPRQDGKVIRFTVKTVEEALFAYPRGLSCLNTHPLQVLAGIVAALGSDVMSPAEVDSASVDPSSATWADISHWVVSRHGVIGAYADRAITDPVPLAAIAAPLLRMLDANLIANESGVVGVKRIDRSAAIAHWANETDFWGFRVVTMNQAFANRILVKTHSGFGQITGGRVADYASRYQLDDTASQARYARVVAGVTKWDTIREMTIDGEWLNAFGFAGQAMTAGAPAVGDTFIVHFGEIYSFCGTRWNGWPIYDPAYTWPTTTAQAADAQLSDDRIAYLRVEGQGGAADEVIACDRCSCYYAMDIESNEWMASASADSIRQAKVMQEGWFRVLSRGALNTVAAAHNTDCEVVDITIPVAMATSLLPRVANGMFRVAVKTGLEKYGYQIGDVISLGYTDFAAYAIDGLDANTLLEIVAKNVDTSGDEPYIEWELVYTNRAAPPASTPAHQSWRQYVPGMRQQMQAAVAAQDVGDTHVISGFGFTDNGVFSGTVGAGVISTLVGRQEMTTDLDLTFQATKDTYLAWEPRYGGYIVEWVRNNGDPVPTIPDAEMFLWKVVTDGVEITGSTDLRVDTAMDGNRLHDLSVAEAQIGPLAVTEGKVGALAITEGKIGALAVTEGKVGALAITSGKIGANAVIAGKLANGAVDTAGRLATGVVTSPAIADSAVRPTHTSNAALPVGVLRNSTHNHWRSV